MGVMLFALSFLLARKSNYTAGRWKTDNRQPIQFTNEAIIPPPIPSTLGYRELCTLLFPRGTPPTCVPRPQASVSSSPGTDVSNSAVAANDVLHTAADHHADALPLRGPWHGEVASPGTKSRAPPPKHLPPVAPEEAHR